MQYDEYYYNVISNLLGNTLICDNIFNANTIAKKYGNSFKIVTLDGDIVMTSGAMTGGSRRKDAGSLLSNERKIQECKENILRKQKYIEKLKVAIAESEKAREKAEEEVEKLRAKYQSSLSEQAALEQREAALGQQIENAEADIAVYREALQELNAKLEALRSEEENSSKSEEELNSLRADAEEQLTSQRSQCDRFRAEREEKSKNLHDLEVEYAALVSAMEKEEETVRRLTSEKEELVKRIMETEQSRKDFQGKLNELEAVAQEKELTEEERAAVQEIMDKIAAISKEKRRSTRVRRLWRRKRPLCRNASPSSRTSGINAKSKSVRLIPISKTCGLESMKPTTWTTRGASRCARKGLTWKRRRRSLLFSNARSRCSARSIPMPWRNTTKKRRITTK